MKSTIRIGRTKQGKKVDYLYRRHIIKTRWFSLYLHKFLGDDPDPNLHDHPKPNISIPLSGPYIEEVFINHPRWGQQLPLTKHKYRRRFIPVFRRATTAHRVKLKRDRYGYPVPTWSLFIMGPVVQNWGFWALSKSYPFENAVKIPWQDYLTKGDEYYDRNIGNADRVSS